MLQISWKKVNEMGQVVHVLANSPKVDKTASYRAGRIFAMFKSTMPQITKEREEIWKKYCDKDEKLNPKVDPDGNLMFTNEENMKKCQEEVDKLFSENFIAVKVHKLAYDGIKDQLTGAELVAIEDIVDGIPEIA